MYKSTLLLLCFFMGLLVGCQTPYSPPPPAAVHPPPQTSISPPPSPAVRPPPPPVVRPSPPASVKIEDSQFDEAATFIGINTEISYAIDRDTLYLLRSWVNKKSGQVTHQLYITNFYYGDWIFWSRASSEDAQPLEFIAMQSKVIDCAYSRCSYSETFGALIPDAVLRIHQHGISVKFYAKTGKEMVIRLTSQQIQLQLKAIEDFQASKNK
jgi:hypothetical protein